MVDRRKNKFLLKKFIYKTFPFSLQPNLTRPPRNPLWMTPFLPPLTPTHAPRFRFLCKAPFFCLCCTLSASDGRLYRCDVTTGLSNGTLTRTDDAASEDDWQEHEASRTHSVKFTDPQEQDNREVSSHSYPSMVWLVGCYSRAKETAVRWCCASRGRSLSRSNSYYMLNALRDTDDVYAAVEC